MGPTPCLRARKTTQGICMENAQKWSKKLIKFQSLLKFTQIFLKIHTKQVHRNTNKMYFPDFHFFFDISGTTYGHFRGFFLFWKNHHFSGKNYSQNAKLKKNQKSERKKQQLLSCEFLGKIKKIINFQSLFWILVFIDGISIGFWKFRESTFTEISATIQPCGIKSSAQPVHFILKSHN